MQKKKRILIKLSGELLGFDGTMFNQESVNKVVDIIIKMMATQKYEIFLVLGGGNIVRGRELKEFKFEKGVEHSIGMLSTIMNALVLKFVFEQKGLKAHVMGPSSAETPVVHAYQPGKAEWWSGESNHVVIFGGGLNLRGFTTDTTAVSRAYEIGADLVIKVTGVGALYDSDPKQDTNAKQIPSISLKEAFDKRYGVLDLTAFAFALENNIPIKIIGLEDLYDRDFLDTSFGSLIS